VIKIKDKNNWLRIIEKFYYSKIKGCKQLEPPDETEIVKMEMQQVVEKMERSWNNFIYAAEEFTEIAVMELYRDELEYGILYKKLLLLYGLKKDNNDLSINSRDHLSWLKKDNH
jgi:hypothetical protein